MQGGLQHVGLPTHDRLQITNTRKSQVKKTISSFRELNRHDGPIVETLDGLLVEERALDLGRCDEQSSHESDGPTSHRCIHILV